MNGTGSAEAHARRLMRLYPAAWRRRYGDEFVELLIADLTERPHCPSRTLDVFRGGVVARMNGAGLVGPAVEPRRQASTSLAVLGSALALFLTFGVSVWAQLSIGWQWSAPSTSATTMAMITMSVCVLLFALLGVAASLPIVAGVLRAVARHDARSLGRPLLLVASGALVLIVGSRHFANGWPGTGGHAWAHQGLVPGGVAAFAWASTLSVTSYWAHPSALAAFPPAEVAWMFISPFALCSRGSRVGQTRSTCRPLPGCVALRGPGRHHRGARHGGVPRCGLLVGAPRWVRTQEGSIRPGGSTSLPCSSWQEPSWWLCGPYSGLDMRVSFSAPLDRGRRRPHGTILHLPGGPSLEFSPRISVSRWEISLRAAVGAGGRGRR